MASASQSEGRKTRLAEQRRKLPDGPGVYLFHDAKGKVIYVGKAKSIKKRVASHFSNPVTRGAPTRWSTSIDSVEFVLVASRDRGAAGRAELHQAVPAALQHPAARRQVLSVHRDLDGRGRSRASTSRASATAATRAVLRARTRTPSACARRSTCSARSSCSARATGAEPGRRSGSPCLDYYIKRCGAPCVGYGVDRAQYMESIDGVRRLPLRPLPRDRARPRGADEGGVGQAGVRAGGAGAQPPAAVRSLLQNASASPTSRTARSTSSRSRPTGPTPTPRSSSSATACCPTASRSTSTTSRRAASARSPRSSCCSTTARRRSIPPQIIVQAEVEDLEPLAEAAGRAARREGRGARRRARRQGAAARPGRAQRAPGARPGEAEGRAPPPAARRGARRPAGGAGARRAAAADRVLRHLQPDGHAHGRVDGRLRGRRAEEVRLPALHDPRRRGGRARRLRGDGGGARRAGWPTGSASRTSPRTTPSATSRSRRCPT